MPGPLVHYTLTRDIGESEGLSHNDAVRLGKADLAVDALWPGSRKWTRHFNPTALLFWAPLNYVLAVRHASIAHLGFALHSLQDALGHGVFGLSHMRLRFNLIGRDPDVWDTMPAGMQRRIERMTRHVIRRYLRRTSGEG